MKKNAACFLALLFSFCVIACASSSAIEGKWKTEFDSVEAGGKVELVYEFTPHGNLFVGSGEGEEAFSVFYGTYSVSGEKLVIVSEEDGETEYEFTVTDSLLTLTDPESGRSTCFSRQNH